MSIFKAIEDVWEYLDSIPMFSKVGSKASNFGLENIYTFCEQIGNPHKDFKSIHIAGTNGKGTTSYLLEEVYRKGGFKTGMFTSPHLLAYNERVKISGVEITDSKILHFFREVELGLKKVPLTYFEISTALAFWTFSKEQVDIAIIETGLGGRLDSTNIIDPELSIITSIGKDHEAILGDTLEKIALEKAGIIKQGKPVILGDIEEKPLNVISEYARSKKSKVIVSSGLKPNFKEGLIGFEVNGRRFKTCFKEPINKWNVAISFLAVKELQDVFEIKESTFKNTMESFSGVPARFEKLHLTKEWYFSGAHNEQAIDAMLTGVHSIPNSRKILILSLMKDKVNPSIFQKLDAFNKVYYYQQEGERAASINDIRPYLEVEEITEGNRKNILNELNTELVIFAGSFYFYPIIKRWLTK